MSPEIKFIILIMLISFFPICYKFYLNWRSDKWHEPTGMSWDETYTTLVNVLLAWKDTEFKNQITDGAVECGHFFI